MFSQATRLTSKLRYNKETERTTKFNNFQGDWLLEVPGVFTNSRVEVSKSSNSLTN